MVLRLSAELMLYVLIGIYLQKRKIVNDDFEKQLSNMLLEVILPLMIIRSMQMKLTADDIYNCGFLLVLCTGWVLFSFMFGQVLWYVSGKNASGRIFRFACIFTNFTFIGLPVISAVFDQQTVFYFTIYVIPLRIALYSTCELIMTPPERYSGKSGAGFWRNLCSPPLLAVVVGLVLCILGWKIPEIFDIVMKNVSDLSLPLGMIVCGLIIGKFDMRRVFSLKAIGIMLIRNLLLPGLVFLFCRICSFSATITQVAVMCAALPVGTLLATFASKYDGCEQSRYESVGAVILSTMFSSITIPIWIGILTMN